MKRIKVIFLMMLVALKVAADDQVFLLTGMVRDKLTSAQLIGAQVRMYDLKDSLIAQGTAHEWDWDYQRDAQVESARFYLGFTKRKGTFKLKIWDEEHDTLWTTVNLDDVGRRELKRDLGVYYLTKTQTKQLDEVTVTATKIKFYHRGDTLVYNADAFQLAEGSMLDGLIKQLPGVELKDGGEIFVNGKKVESLLLNGKDFFRGDNQIMLDNLAAYTVKNIEVYKKQTDRARFLGLDNEENKQLTMDVKLKKEYIGGWTGNVEAGGGTEDRYLGKLFAMHFNASSQFTLIGNMNNLNDSRRPTNDSSWEPKFRPNGTKTYREVGANYSTENDDGTRKASGSLTFDAEKNLFDQQSNSTNYLQTMTTQSRSQSHNLNREFNLSTRHELLWQNKWLSLKLEPNLRFSRGKGEGGGESATWNPGMESPGTGSPAAAGTNNAEAKISEGQLPVPGLSMAGLINSTLNEAFSSTYNLYLGSSLSATIKIPKTSDAIDLWAGFSHNNSRDESDSRSIILYGDQTQPTSARNTLQRNRPQHNNNGRLGASYLLRFNDKLSLKMEYSYHFLRETKTSAFYLGQLEASQTGDYTLENLRSIERAMDPTNSNNSLMTSRIHRLSPKFSWELSKTLELSVSTSFQSLKRSLDLNQNAKDHHASFNENCFDGNSLDIYWRKSKESSYTSFQLEYSTYRQQPEMTFLMDIENTRDPLVRTIANPNLKSSVHHRFMAFFQRSLHNKYQFYGYVYGGPVQNIIVSGSTYETATGKRTYRYYNLDGTWHFSGNADFSWEATKWLTIHPSGSYGFRKSFTMIGENALEPTKYGQNAVSYCPKLELRFRPTQKLSFSLKTGADFQRSTSNNPSALKTSYREDAHGFTLNAQLPWKFSLQTTLMNYSRHGFDDEKMNTSEWIWNGRLTKSLLKGKLLASLSAYDLLHQIQTVTYYVSPQSRLESFTNTIPRYVLLHFQYKFNVKPKQKIAQTVKYY